MCRGARCTPPLVVQDYVQAKDVTVPWLRGTHNPADLLTKALTHDDHMKHTDLILKGISQSIAPKPSGRGGVHGSDNPPGVDRQLDRATT